MRERLSKSVGIEPSEAWLSACLAASNNSNHNENESFLLEQLLHHDLHDVVDKESMRAPSRQLRQAIHASATQKVALPETFRLLVQVEAVSNMAVGTEKRLASGTTTNPQTRCLSIAYHDGYDHTDNGTTTTSAAAAAFTAMEVIPLLNFQGIAGTKVLLKGPLTLRHGIMGWTPATAIVLGGVVDEMVQAQQQAMQRAQQRSGHGVDPTIKALIWSNQNNTLEEQEDESERSSEDVTRARVPQHQPAAAVTAPVAQPARTHAHQIQQQAVAAGRGVQPRIEDRHRSSATTQPLVPPPYNRGGVVGPATISPPVIPPPQPRPQPPAVTTAMSQHHHSSTSSTRVGYEQPSPAGATAHSHAPPPFAMSSQSSRTTTTTTTAPQATPPVALRAAPVDATSYQCMPFPQLRHSLQRAVSDAEMRHHLQNKVFTTQLSQVGNHIHFNIEKCKTTGGSKNYKYILDAKFRGPSEADGLITCRVASEILEPLFSIPPAEMRKLNKKDKQRATQLVSEGGKMVQREMKKLRSYNVTLFPPPSDGAATSVDGAKPILLLQQPSV